MEINKVLGEMRALQARINPTATAATGIGKAVTGGAAGVAGATAAPGVDFASLLKTSVDRVAGMQNEAKALASAYESGDRSIDLTKVMLETQKAGLAFRAMTEVRNKLIDAYHEIMNMQV